MSIFAPTTKGWLASAIATVNATTNSTTAVALGNLSNAITVPGGVSAVKVTLYVPGVTNGSSTDGATISIWDGTVGSGTQIGGGNFFEPNFTTSAEAAITVMAVVTVAAGTAKTYNAGFQAVSGGTVTAVCGTTDPMLLLTEAI